MLETATHKPVAVLSNRWTEFPEPILPLGRLGFAGSAAGKMRRRCRPVDQFFELLKIISPPTSSVSFGPAPARVKKNSFGSGSRRRRFRCTQRALPGRFCHAASGGPSRLRWRPSKRSPCPSGILKMPRRWTCHSDINIAAGFEQVRRNWY